MKILLTGAGGMLGTDLLKTLYPLGTLVGMDIDDFDITDQDQTREAVMAVNPDLTVHAAAFTAVDLCEEERSLALNVNGAGAGNVARACKEANSKMFYFSSDYIFDGTSHEPYSEDAAPNPLSVYGRSKLEGEQQVRKHLPDNHLIIRTSWLFGVNGKNFVETIINLSQQKPFLNIIDDEKGSPTYTLDLAEATRTAAELNLMGTINITNSGETSWYGFAAHFMERVHPGFPLKPIPTEAYPLPAKRPGYSVLSGVRWKQLTGSSLPHWRNAVERYLTERK